MAIRAAPLRIIVQQGAPYNKKFKRTSGGSPVDLTGRVLVLQVRSRRTPANKPSVLAEWRSDGADPLINVTDAEQGEFEFDVPASATAEYAFKDAEHDLVMLVDGDVVERTLQGPFLVDASVAVIEVAE